MSFDYLKTSYFNIPELIESKIIIDNTFKDFASLDKYLYITVAKWDRDYPLPPLPNGIIVLEILCDYKFPLNNLPSSIEVLCLYSTYKYPLENLPINLYKLNFLHSISEYKNSLNSLPESVKILNLENVINQSSCNLPIGLKFLHFSSDTFTDEIVNYPPELEQLYLYLRLTYSGIPSFKELEEKERYFNLINIPLSVRILELPDINISNLDIFLKRLVHLEELYISNYSEDPILEYPPNLVKLYISGYYGIKHKLVNLPASLKYISLGMYNESLDAVANSNIEHIDRVDNRELAIFNYLPKSLKELSIIKTHFEIHKIIKETTHIKINIRQDYDYEEALIDSMRSDW
jgi:hypothetical protein